MTLEVDSFSSGQIVRHYKIERMIGHGGMGIVLKADDLKLHRPVALKFLSSQLSSNYEAIQQFRREAIVSSNINHPGICTILTIDSIDLQSFIVMEFLEGETLCQILKNNGPLPEQQTLDIVYQICSALKTAHSLGIVHRDIKPENIMLCPRTQKIKIMDFGVAKLAQDLAENISQRIPHDDLKQTKASNQFSPNQLSMTYSGFMGTSSYMSPEQCLANPIDHRSDIFSLSILVYELLTNQKPFKGNGHLEIMRNIVENDPIPVGDINSDLKYDWNAALSKGLEKDITKRFQSCEDLEKALDLVHRKRKNTQKKIKNSFFLASKKKSLVAFMIFIINLLLLVGFILGRRLFFKSQKQERELLDKALYFIRDEDWDRAMAVAHKAIKQSEKTNDPKIISDAYSTLGKIMHQKGNENQAIQYFEYAVKLYPKSINTSAQLAEIYALEGNINKAELILRNILKAPLDLSDRVIAYSCIGSLLIYSGRFVEGLASLENAVDLSFESKNYSNIYALLEQTFEVLLEFNQPSLAEKKRLQIKKDLEQANYSNDSLKYLIEFTIPLKIAIFKNDWQNAENILSFFKNSVSREKVFNSNKIYFLLKRGRTNDIQLLEEKVKQEAQFIETTPVDLKYNIAYYLVSQSRYEQATDFLKDIIQTKELFKNGFPLYYNKALSLLSEINEVSGNRRYSEELCYKFLKNWEKADPELEMFDKIQARYNRLKNSKINNAEFPSVNRDNQKL